MMMLPARTVCCSVFDGERCGCDGFGLERVGVGLSGEGGEGSKGED